MITAGLVLVVLAIFLGVMFGAVGIIGGILLIVFGDMFLVTFLVIKFISKVINGSKRKEEA